MSLNSGWLQKYKPSKLKKLKNIRFSMEIGDFLIFFQHLRPVFLEPLGLQRRYVSHFKGIISVN